MLSFRFTNYTTTLNSLFTYTIRTGSILALMGLLGGITGCTKLVAIDAPVTSIPEAQVFAGDSEAINALSGVYYKLANSNTPTLVNGASTIYPALSADELLVFDQGNSAAVQFNQNALLPDNVYLASQLWATAYQSIYHWNSILQNAQASDALTTTVRDQLIGQAYFGRALLHYHLATLFEAIPLIISTNWRHTSHQPQTGALQVYAQLIADLQEAIKLLPEEYQLLGGGKLIANKWAAVALLAKIHAQVNNWEQVQTLTDGIIHSGIYSLPSVAEVFSINSPEAILQWQQDPTSFTFNATCEGMTLIPIDGIFPFPPYGYLHPSLLEAFEPNDQRKDQWVQYRIIDGKQYHYPYKYKVGPSQAIPSAPLTEGYVVIRLAEIYLLRAEARAMLDNLHGSISDLNVVRSRAGLSGLSNYLSRQEVLKALQQERRIELFCEWGHRWNDLKRWRMAANVLQQNKGIDIPAHALLYPIPASELLTNPGLQQHSGY